MYPTPPRPLLPPFRFFDDPQAVNMARSPQRWHIDAFKQFPEAALVLRGKRATEFAAGGYSDFSSEVCPGKLDEWITPLRQSDESALTTWEAGSPEERLHFGRRCAAAGLITGVDAETGDPECDWSKLAAAVPPTSDVAPGSATIFWSNKVHRGYVRVCCGWAACGAWVARCVLRLVRYASATP